jgi:hypothetical protein
MQRTTPNKAFLGAIRTTEMNCRELLEMIEAGRACEPSEYGFKLATQCLYPSADQVYVHVAKWGEGGFRVTDGGGISRSVLVHGRDEHALHSGLTEASNRHALRVEGGLLFADAPSSEWLPAAILAVANGASLAASLALGHVARKSERSLVTRIYEQLSKVVPAHHIARDYEYRGKSGKAWRIDCAVARSDRPLLVKAVTPHHTSISSCYTTFGDIGIEDTNRFCVFQRQLDPDDKALLRQVATLVPLDALDAGTKDIVHRLN